MLKSAVLALISLPLLGAAPSPDPSGGGLERIMLQIHNQARAEAGVPPVTWDSRLAADAQIWADHLADVRRLEHSSAPRGTDPDGEGENLAGGPYEYSPQQLAGLWVDERDNFIDNPMPEVSRTGRWQDAGHYSQMIWRTTTRIGCAMGGSGYLVCRYSRPGNVMGLRAR